MKRLFFLLLSVVLIGSVAHAQDTSRIRTKAPIQKRDRIHQEDHLLYQDGKLYRVQQGVRTQVQEPVRLQNGAVVNPNGAYQLKDQQRQQLRSGECIDMSGNRYQSQRMFNQRRMMTPQQMHRGPGMNRSQGTNPNRTGTGRKGGRS